jgi:hypothetical protein
MLEIRTSSPPIFLLLERLINATNGRKTHPVCCGCIWIYHYTTNLSPARHASNFPYRFLAPFTFVTRPHPCLLFLLLLVLRIVQTQGICMYVSNIALSLARVSAHRRSIIKNRLYHYFNDRDWLPRVVWPSTHFSRDFHTTFTP